jgi:hypothetical protein
LFTYIHTYIHIQDVSYDVVFDNKPYLELDASPTNLSPGQSEEIVVSFMPRELRSYHEVYMYVYVYVCIYS